MYRNKIEELFLSYYTKYLYVIMFPTKKQNLADIFLNLYLEYMKVVSATRV